MSKTIGESTTTTRVFRFASGELLNLEQKQIEAIPYLSALVSAANSFQSVCDEHGRYILDPYIQYKNFLLAIESLSFQSVQQIFTDLPKHNNIVGIVALLDFLAIGPQPNPTLDEVDSAFFSHIIFDTEFHEYRSV
ncbi:unnamed protein product, partial [Rotaria sp. Silwood1]